MLCILSYLCHTGLITVTAMRVGFSAYIWSKYSNYSLIITSYVYCKLYSLYWDHESRHILIPSRFRNCAIKKGQTKYNIYIHIIILRNIARIYVKKLWHNKSSLLLFHLSSVFSLSEEKLVKWKELSFE